MRLFIGSFARLDDYAAIQARYAFLDAAWAAEENLHLTYLFLGQVDDPDGAQEKLEVLDLEPKPLKISGLALLNEKILYARVEADETLYRNFERICRAFNGTITDFTPHITLARIKNPHPRLTTQIVEESALEPLGRLDSEILLIQSRLTPQGPIYKAYKQS